MTTDPVGGVWTFTASLCEQLCIAHQVCLISFGRAISVEQQDWVSALQRKAGPSFLFHASTAPLEWMQDNNEAFTAGVALLAQIADEFKPDLLHANQFCWGALPRHGSLDIPRIVTAHSDVLSWATYSDSRALADTPWLTRYKALVQHGLNGCDAVIAPTHWMLSAIGANFHLPVAQYVVPNGSTMQPLSAPPERRLQAVTAGRLWDPAKGIQFLSGIKSPLPLLVAGDQANHTHVFSNNIKFLGALNQSELIDVFQHSAVYLCPSLYEPFGLAPLEAALCGCALVLRDLPSLRESWAESALYFGGQTELESILQYLATHPENLAKAAAACILRAQLLTSERMCESYLSLFASAGIAKEAEVAAYA